MKKGDKVFWPSFDINGYDGTDKAFRDMCTQLAITPDDHFSEELMKTFVVTDIQETTATLENYYFYDVEVPTGKLEIITK